jgi:HEAT repeat protein
MAVSMKRVRAALEPEEPDYAGAAQLGPDAVPHLQTLIQGDDPMLASKAVYLASLIPDERTADLVQQAAQHDDPVIRVAAASAAQNMDAPAASQVLVALVADDDPGVRKVARAAVPESPTDALAQRLEELPEAGGDQPRRPLGPQEAMGLQQPMPGESAAGGDQMPGETSGQMPGESQGRMPGERP